MKSLTEIPLDLEKNLHKNVQYLESFYLCKGIGNYISNYYVCDGVEDCLDGEDEKEYPNRILFKCNSIPKFISFHMLCNYFQDCPDNSDEIECCTLNPYIIIMLNF